jgi:hypothetical protein
VELAEQGPRAEYCQRLAERQAREARLARRHALLSKARTTIVVLWVVLAWLGEHDPQYPRLVIPPAFVLAAVVGWRSWIQRARRSAARAVQFYEQRLAVLDGLWVGRGEPGTRFLDETHLYAEDLDLFGTGSLFELLCTARTRTGEETLATWLLAPAAPEEIRARQAAVAEMGPRLDLREDVALLGDPGTAGADFADLIDWGKADLPPIAQGLRLAARILPILAAATLVGWIVFGVSLPPLLFVLLLEGGLAWRLRGQARKILARLRENAGDLILLAGLLNRLEHERFTSPRLSQLQAAMHGADWPPSRQIVRLARLIRLMSPATVLLWLPLLTVLIEAWQRRHGPCLARWLTAVGDFEALFALAAYAHDNPTDPFPELVAEGPCFDAEGLGHPLLPRDRCVRNDLRLGGEQRGLIVSGSNMAGKSTLLRSAGINAVLAQAGAPVCARTLRLSLLAVGATLRVQDSLQGAWSRFQAELTRLGQLLDLSRTQPLLFLLDELLGGTNSHDRRLGAEAVLRGLLDRGAIGLITTHDLAITEIGDLLAPRVANVHFEDRFEQGTLSFDYTMRPGVVQHSNALALLRAVGIEV